MSNMTRSNLSIVTLNSIAFLLYAYHPQSAHVLSAMSPCSQAFAQFALDDLITGQTINDASKSNQEQGYSISPTLLSGRQISVCPLPEEVTLQRDGMQTINVREALYTEGITEDNMDPQRKDHRQIVGKVLLEQMESVFKMKAFHLADTSRVDGNAVYGEVTVRDTASDTLRKAHHSFHIDKFHPGICTLYECSSNTDATKIIHEMAGHLWVEDMERENVNASQVEEAMLNGYSINVWVSLTAGNIEQSPLVLVDPKSVQLSNDTFFTMKVKMPGMEDSISLLKWEQSERARFHWIPEMQFGDVLIFSNSNTPHSAVRVLNGSSKPRRSAEMRMVLIERDRDSNGGSIASNILNSNVVKDEL